MATPRENNRARANSNSETHKTRAVRLLQVNKGDDLKTLYAKVRKAFTASDLQRYTQHEEMMSAEQLVEELEAMEHQGRKGKNKRIAQ
jgi:hypothetical protein